MTAKTRRHVLAVLCTARDVLLSAKPSRKRDRLIAQLNGAIVEAARAARAGCGWRAVDGA